jgi:hypothetical protein
MQAPELDDILPLLERTVSATKKLCEGTQIAPRSKHEKLYVLITLYEIARKGDSVVALAQARADSGIPIVVRAAFENYVDIVNLLRHKATYVAYMQYLSWRQQRSLFQSALDNPESSFSKSLVKIGLDEHETAIEPMIQKIDAEMADEKRRLAPEYMQKNRKPTDPSAKVETSEKHRFVLSGNADAYDFVYRHLSASVHGRMTAMLRGVVSDEGIVWPPGVDDDAPIASVDIVTAMILESAFRVGRRYSKNVSQLVALQNDRERILSRYGYSAAKLPVGA